MKIEKVNTIEGAQLALTNRLFINGWLLRDELINIIKFDRADEK